MRFPAEIRRDDMVYQMSPYSYLRWQWGYQAILMLKKYRAEFILFYEDDHRLYTSAPYDETQIVD